MWSIRVLSGQQKGLVFDLKLGKNVLGRGGNSDFKIQSLGISKEHCEIHVYKDKTMIVDLKSSNGTFVNGVKIQNSIIRVGDKISLFDVIMDIIPTPDIRPKSTPRLTQSAAMPPVPATQHPMPQMIPPQPHSQMVPSGFPTPQGGNALQMNYQQQAHPYYGGGPAAATQANEQAAASAPQLSFQEKAENYIENVVMPAVYRLGIIFSFKQLMVGFILVYILMVTILSTIPLINIIKESNLQEAEKRAKSVARAMAKFNEQALLANQFASLSVQEALKEEGIKDAIIVKQSDGLIVAPPEKAGRDMPSSIVLIARKEGRAVSRKINSTTIGASFPIAAYDPSTGEATPKYHAIVTYDISILNVNTDRIVSLFMQIILISSGLGLILYFLFSRLIEYPIKSLNTQINKALIDKSDRTEVAFDYPAFQQLVSNVNTILNRAWSGDAGGDSGKPQQNKDIEFSNLVDIVFHPSVVVDKDGRIVALNSKFEELSQASKDSLLNSDFHSISDNALVQNIESLVARSTQNPYEKQSDKIPFSQYECDIYCQAFLDADSRPQYFVMTLVPVTEGS